MNKERIDQMLTNYHWIVKLIKDHNQDIRVNVTAQGGIESSMPKAQGGTSDPVASEVMRRMKDYEVIERHTACVEYIQERIHLITNKTQAEVLALILGGHTTTEIMRGLGLSYYRVCKAREQIVNTFKETCNKKEHSV